MLGRPRQAGEVVVVGVGLHSGDGVDFAHPDRGVAIDAQGAAGVESSLGGPFRCLDLEAHRVGDAAQRHPGAGKQRLQEHAC